jgi:hypothetical protein
MGIILGGLTRVIGGLGHNYLFFFFSFFSYFFGLFFFSLGYFCPSRYSFTIATSLTSSFTTLIIITFVTFLHLSNFFPTTFLFYFSLQCFIFILSSFSFVFLIMMGSMIKPKALSSFEYLTHTFHLGMGITHLPSCVAP